MSEAIVAKRYADALFQLGKEKNSLEQYADEFRVVREVFKNNKQLVTILKHPKIDNVKKKQFISEVFQGVHIDVVNTIKLVVERHRTDAIPSIINHFIQLVNDAKGIAEATVYSVRELSDSEKQQLQLSFSKRLGKTSINLLNVVDPSVIGGVKIRVGNTIYDGTVSGKLNRISRKIVSAN
ncbi:F0F1 ATP synthase subunit delta [Oceanobacillus massiliensis]|uniref:F0F1 ATP synthase subunit delta n=1 Tax=Oceanobacillus massiliensis TaxID=1465765 RepID=UPI00028A3A0E|nr:F0F1 ATP synthase subunit delta [Oceanobacillus massiliensis]